MRPALSALISVSMLIAPASVYGASSASTTAAVSPMFSLASSVICIASPGGCVLPVKPQVTAPPAPEPVPDPVVAEVAEEVAEESDGFGLRGVLLGLLGAAGIVAGIVAISGNEDDVPASP